MYASENITHPKLSWYEIWWQVWAYPGEKSFRAVLGGAEGGATRSFVWVSLMAMLLSAAANIHIPEFTWNNFTFSHTTINTYIFETLNWKEYPALEPGRVMLPPVKIGVVDLNDMGFRWLRLTWREYAGINQAQIELVSMILIAIVVAPFLAQVGLALLAAIYRGAGLAFGGKGEWGNMLFFTGAVLAPVMLLLIPIAYFGRSNPGLFAGGSLGSYILLGLGAALGIYVLVLLSSAQKANENFDWPKAVITHFITLSIVGLLLGVSLIWLASASLNFHMT